MTTALEQS